MEAVRQVFEAKRQQVGCSCDLPSLALTAGSLGNCSTDPFRYGRLPHSQRYRRHPVGYGAWRSRYNRARCAILRSLSRRPRHPGVKYGTWPCQTCVSSLTLSKIAVEQDVTYARVLGQVKAARDRGLNAPVLLMGSSYLIKVMIWVQMHRRILQPCARIRRAEGHPRCEGSWG